MPRAFAASSRRRCGTRGVGVAETPSGHNERRRRFRFAWPLAVSGVRESHQPSKVDNRSSAKDGSQAFIEGCGRRRSQRRTLDRTADPAYATRGRRLSPGWPGCTAGTSIRCRRAFRQTAVMWRTAGRCCTWESPRRLRHWPAVRAAGRPFGHGCAITIGAMPMVRHCASLWARCLLTSWA